MLPTRDVDRIALRAARTAFPRGAVARVFSSPTVDSTGDEALDVTVVLRSEALALKDPDSAINPIVRVGRGLQAGDDEQIAIFSFTTEAELTEAELDEAESPEP